MPPSLPRRALIGVALGDDPTPADAGIHVASVIAGSMAERAGMRSGDRLVRIADAAITSASEAARAARTIASAPRVTLAFARGTALHEVEVEVSARPPERVEGAEVIYDHVTVDGRRLRTITTLPSRAPAPAVLLMQGIARASIDFAAAPDAPLARLVRGWADAGFATARVEKWGVGDSEGEAEDADFVRELAGYRAALDALSARAQVAQVFAFGHSLGGMALPLLERRLAGAIVYGTSARRWSECMRASAERQLRLRGASEAVIARRLASQGSPAHGVTRAFLAQLEGAELRAAWARFAAPLLVLYGELDWVVSRQESEELAAICPGARLLTLPGLDHAFGAHADLRASLDRYGHGAADPRVLTATLEHMRGILSAEGPDEPSSSV